MCFDLYRLHQEKLDLVVKFLEVNILEQYKGKKYVHNLVNQIAGMNITFEKYPVESEFFENLRARINKELDEI